MICCFVNSDDGKPSEQILASSSNLGKSSIKRSFNNRARRNRLGVIMFCTRNLVVITQEEKEQKRNEPAKRMLAIQKKLADLITIVV